MTRMHLLLLLALVVATPASAATVLQSGVQVSGTTTPNVMTCYYFDVTSSQEHAVLIPEVSGPANSQNVTAYAEYGKEPTRDNYTCKAVAYSVTGLNYWSCKSYTFFVPPIPKSRYYFCVYAVGISQYNLTVTAKRLLDVELSTEYYLNMPKYGGPLYIPMSSISVPMKVGIRVTPESVTPYVIVYSPTQSYQKSNSYALKGYLLFDSSSFPPLRIGGCGITAHYNLQNADSMSMWICSDASCTKPTQAGPSGATPTPALKTSGGGIGAGSYSVWWSVASFVASVLVLVG